MWVKKLRFNIRVISKPRLLESILFRIHLETTSWKLKLIEINWSLLQSSLKLRTHENIIKVGKKSSPYNNGPYSGAPFKKLQSASEDTGYTCIGSHFFSTNSLEVSRSELVGG